MKLFKDWLNDTHLSVEFVGVYPLQPLGCVQFT